MAEATINIKIADLPEVKAALAAAETEIARLRKGLAFAASALESGELHAAPLIRKVLDGEDL